MTLKIEVENVPESTIKTLWQHMIMCKLEKENVVMPIPEIITINFIDKDPIQEHYINLLLATAFGVYTKQI